MYTSEYMVAPVITITPDTLVHDALWTMHQNNIRRLPVVDNGKLVGLVTRHRVREATPSTPVPLSIWGAHYQLAKMKVRDIMITDVITITPDSTIEEAAILSSEHRIGTLPVVDNNGILVGIITGTDLYRLLTQALGFGQKGVRLHILGLSTTEGMCQYRIMEIMCQHQINVFSAFSIIPPRTQQEDLIIHVANENIDAVVDELSKLGLNVEVREH